MSSILKKVISISLIVISIVYTTANATPEQSPVYYDFNAMPAHQLIDTISMRFATSSQFTVIQWNLKAGAKLMHSINIQMNKWYEYLKARYRPTLVIQSELYMLAM